MNVGTVVMIYTVSFDRKEGIMRNHEGNQPDLHTHSSKGGGMSRQKRKTLALFLVLGALTFLTGTLYGQNASDCRAKIGETYLESTPCWPAPVQAPKAAPNVVIIALDDVGFGHLGSYGSAIETPNLDNLAKGGLLYTNFHTTALCSPTRACILNGRNHHSVGMGVVTEIATGYPGYNSIIPKSAAALPEVLRQNGYSTFAVGKWHQTPVWEVTPLGPFDRWPTGQGFDRFYGFLGGETNQYSPELYYGNIYVDPPRTPEQGYHAVEDFTDMAIKFIADDQMINPGKPFFLYLAYGACHAPHHVPREWINKYLTQAEGGTGEYAGKFDKGWDEIRNEVLAQQKKMGIVPPNTELSQRPDWIKAWNTLSDDEKRLFIRMQEVFAAYLSYTDSQIGRFIDYLRSMGKLDDTLLIVFSDNGASAEGGEIGSVNENRWFNNVPESLADNLAMFDELGGPLTYNHYPMGWAHAGNTPFKRYKRQTFEGGVADPLLIHWPKGIQEKGIRTQFNHAIDVYPTVLEAVGIKMPDKVNGVKQMPLEGISLAYTFNNPKAPTKKETQYFEMFGMRAIWHKGWKAIADHPLDSSYFQQRDTWVDDKWALYHVDEDVSEVHDLAAKYPGKLNQLKNLWESEARKYNVLPLDDRATFRVDPGRPKARLEVLSYTYYPGMTPLNQASAVDTLNRDFKITAYIAWTPSEGAEGVLVAQGGRFGGYSLFIKNKKLYYVHNYVGIESESTTIESLSDVPSGEFTVGFEFVKTGELDLKNGKGAPGIGILYVNGDEVGRRDIPVTIPQGFSLAGDGFCVGRDVETPVSNLYNGGFDFTGVIEKVVIEVSPRAAATNQIGNVLLKD